jgi:subtilisin family serine protease
VNGIEVEGNPLLRAQISARPGVARVLNSPHARPLPSSSQGITIPSDGSYSAGSLAAGVDAIDAEKVWAELNDMGEGIVVGIADSGVDWHHPAVHDQYLGSEGNHDYTWFDPWEGTSEPTDTGGHGTHTTGTVLGSDGIGVAPGAKWIACRNLARNLGNPGYYLDCMQFLFAPFPQDGDPFTDGDPARGAQVTNNSWGCPPQEGCDAITLSIAVEVLRNAGQMFVVSAGNDGPTCDTIWAPANAEDGLAVGASDPLTGEIADFSSRGPVLSDGSGRIKPDVTAPGESIPSSVPGGGYASLEGTSMAGPHVAGVVALMWSANPSLIGNTDLTKQIIEETAGYRSASDLCGADTGTENNVYGYGNIDALKAVQAALNAP